MADINCIKCGEAFDASELHDWEGPNGEARTYRENLHAYMTGGCPSIGMTCNTVPAYGSDAGMIASIMYDILGDDIDCMEDMMDMARDFGFNIA